jgi:phosphopantothenoylcysteine decarboxylase/phosphopantothenate--cysteine ligase
MPSSRKSAFKSLRILITSGPTSVPIDSMRVITNRSTGEMGRLLATACAHQGAKVHLLEGAVTTSLPVPSSVKTSKFYFYNELATLLKQELRHHYDIIFHAAAVSDFYVKNPSRRKLASGANLTIELQSTRKLVNEIKKHSPNSFLVGFKFEQNIDSKVTVKKAKCLILDSACDCVVLNQNNSAGYKAVLVLADGSISNKAASRKSLVSRIIALLHARLTKYR